MPEEDLPEDLLVQEDLQEIFWGQKSFIRSSRPKDFRVVFYDQNTFRRTRRRSDVLFSKWEIDIQKNFRRSIWVKIHSWGLQDLENVQLIVYDQKTSSCRFLSQMYFTKYSRQIFIQKDQKTCQMSDSGYTAFRRSSDHWSRVKRPSGDLKGPEDLQEIFSRPKTLGQYDFHKVF